MPSQTDWNQYFRDNYNSSLSPKEEAAFVAWAQQFSKVRGYDVLKDLQDYDLRGYWKESGGKVDRSPHLTDRFKKPNHPTFSDESKYSGVASPFGGNFVGGQWIESEDGWQFKASKEMLEQTHDPVWLEKYMQKVEPDVKLVLPE